MVPVRIKSERSSSTYIAFLLIDRTTRVAAVAPSVFFVGVWSCRCPRQSRSTVRKFIYDNLAHKLAESRRGRGMYDAVDREDEWDEDTDFSLCASGVYI